MSRLDRILDESVERQVLPFVVAMVGDRAGVRWQGSAGRANAAHDAGPETVFSLFSMTKAVGSLMAVMAIDRGLITMDTPVGDVLPDFEKIQVLESMGPDGPIYRRPKTRATLRHLLTHTCGMGYEAFYPAMADYAVKTGSAADITGKFESLYYPMLFDPGEGFAYGVGTDWVGVLVSELDGRPIDRFVHEEILQPLGMSSTYFERADAGDRLANLFLKGEDGQFSPFEMYPAANPEIYHMGHALYSSAADYMTFLRLVLNGGELDGHRLVGPEAMKLMYTDQLEGVPLPSPLLKSSVPFVSYDVDPRPGTRKTHTAAFFRSEEDVPAMRRAGSLSWAGVLNTHYWVDPASDIAAVFMTQMLPFYDPELIASYEEFERGVYQEFRQ
jgi:methyl acetate hydrolase